MLVRPGWLRRKGYFVLYQNKASGEKMMQKIVPLKNYGKGSKKKRTYIPDKQLMNNIHCLPEIYESVYYPNVLHQIATEGKQGVIIAVGRRGKKRLPLRVLELMQKPNGRFCWVSISPNRCFNELMQNMNGLWLRFLEELLPPDAGKRIYQALRLGEAGF